MTGGLGFVRMGKDSSANYRSLLKHTDRVISKKGAAHDGDHSKLTFKKATPEEVAKVVDAFKEEARNEQRRKVIIGAIVAIILSVLFYVVFW